MMQTNQKNRPSIQSLPIHTLPSGDQLTINVNRWDIGRPGPITYLQANVHGAEIQGNLVLWQLEEYLATHEFNGQFIIVPQANPFGLNQKAGTFTTGRFNPLTGENWNRNYKDIIARAQKINPHILDDFCKTQEKEGLNSLAQNFKIFLKSLIHLELKKLEEYGPDLNSLLNLTLQSLACEADYVLDLHTAPVACRYLYAAEYLEQKAQDFGFPFGIIIPHSFDGAMDEASFMPWIHLQTSMPAQTTIPFEAYTLELGSEEVIDHNMAKKDFDSLLHFLTCRKILPQQEKYAPNFPKWHARPLSQYKTYYASTGGLMEFLAKPGELVKKGHTLGKIYHMKNKTCTPITAKQDGHVINHGASSNVHQGMSLYQILEF